MRGTDMIKNLVGPTTKRKLLAIFADDYGSIRVKDKNAKKRLVNSGIRNSIYLNDTLASNKDLQCMFDMLLSLRDTNGNAACVTPFTIVANPDFDRIKDNGYETYFREPFTVTLKRYGKEYENTFELWRQGMADGIFVPAFHGTEHLNVRKWMCALQKKHLSTCMGFDNESICIPSLSGEESVEGLVRECDVEKAVEVDGVCADLREGIRLFRDLFGESPCLFTPGAGVYCPRMEDSLVRMGLTYLDVSRNKVQPMGDGRSKREIHFLGQKNKLGLKYIVRNCAFEPIRNGDGSIVTCMNQIAAAFYMNKPAIISTHRLNYIGHFDEKNRTDNINRLHILLSEVTKKWPEVEFVSGKKICELYQ